MKKILYRLIIMTLLLSPNTKSEHIVVLGASAAGTSFIKEMIDHKFGGTITWLTEQKEHPYKKTQIDSVLEGTKSPDAIKIFDTATLPSNISYVSGKKAVTISPQNQCITLDDSSHIKFDKLFISIGVQLEPGEFRTISGVFPFNTLSDTQKITDYLAHNLIKHAVVVGLGISGLEVCEVLSKKGIHVHGIDRSHALLSHYINQEASDFFQSHLTGKLALHLSAKIASIECNHGHVSAVVLDSGTRIPTELVIFTTGGKIDEKLMASSGIKIQDGGIVVDHHMKTNIPTIFAGGDCARVKDLSTGLFRRSGKWKDAEEQGRIAAQNMLGESSTYPGSKFFYGSEFYGIHFQSYGPVRHLSTHCPATTFTDHKTYFHYFVREQGVLKGYIILDTQEVADRELLKKTVDEAQPLSDDDVKRLHEKIRR